MIIHRLASAIRNQNWSQITTEILIVVIGIFLGLQVQAWYDGRVDGAEEAQLVDYMIVDLENNIEYLERREAAYLENIEAGIRFLNLLKNTTLEEEEIADFNRGLQFSGTGNGIDNSLVSFKNNNFEKILNPVLKRNINGFITELDTEKIAMQNGRIVTQSVLPVLRTKAVAYRQNEFRSFIDYDFDELKKDDEFRRAYTQMVNVIITYRYRTAAAKRRAELLLPILKDYRVGKEIEEVSFE